MKRFELFEYDKETERLETEQELKEGLGKFFSNFAQKTWQFITTIPMKLKFGQQTRTSLTPMALKENYLVEAGGGWGASSYGIYAEFRAIEELLERLRDEGFKIVQSDIVKARETADRKAGVLQRDINDWKKHGKLFHYDKNSNRVKIAQRGKDKGQPLVKKGKITPQEVSQHNARLKAAEAQARALANRTFDVLTESGDAYLSRYRVDYKKISVRGAGQSTEKDTADLIVEKLGTAEAVEFKKISLKAVQTGAAWRKQTTLGTGIGLEGMLQRELARSGGMNMSDVGSWKKFFESPGLVKNIFDRHGVDYFKYAKVRTEVQKLIAEDIAKGMKKDEARKKWENKFKQQLQEEVLENWPKIFNEVVNNSKFKNEFKEEVRRIMDIDMGNPSVLITAGWNKETGMINSFTKVSKELTEFMKIRPEDLDMEITTRGRDITITISYVGDKKLKFWEGEMKISKSLLTQWTSDAYNERVHNETVDGMQINPTIWIDDEFADDMNALLDALNKIEDYFRRKGWGDPEDYNFLTKSPASAKGNNELARLMHDIAFSNISVEKALQSVEDEIEDALFKKKMGKSSDVKQSPENRKSMKDKIARDKEFVKFRDKERRDVNSAREKIAKKQEKERRNPPPNTLPGQTPTPKKRTPLKKFSSKSPAKKEVFVPARKHPDFFRFFQQQDKKTQEMIRKDIKDDKITFDELKTRYS